MTPRTKVWACEGLAASAAKIEPRVEANHDEEKANMARVMRVAAEGRLGRRLMMLRAMRGTESSTAQANRPQRAAARTLPVTMARAGSPSLRICERAFSEAKPRAVKLPASSGATAV